mgnify:CR=1 FL=1
MVEVLTGTFTVKAGHAQMLKGGVIMDVVNAEQAKIAAEAGAVAVMALERVPADIRADGGVARMTDPQIICDIMDAVSIPVMAKVRIGHFVEAQILESIGIDYIDEVEEDGAKALVDKAMKHGNAWLGMCSTYTVNEPRRLDANYSAGFAKIMRLVAENWA